MAGIWHFPNIVISRPNYDCLNIKPGRLPFFCIVERGLAVTVTWHVSGNVPGGRNTHMLGSVAHVDAGSWILQGRGCNMHFPRRATHSTCIWVRSADYMLGKSDCPCTKTKVENTIFLQIFKLEECQFPLVLISFCSFQFFLKNEGRVVFFDFLFCSAVSREKPIPTQHGKRDNKQVKIAILEGSRFVHSGHFTSK